MKEEGIYQRALATAIEQAANSQLAVKEHLRRLAFMKDEKEGVETPDDDNTNTGDNTQGGTTTQGGDNQGGLE